MTLTDPARPQINHQPAYSCGGAVLPRLSLWPKSHDLTEVGAMLMVGHNLAEWKLAFWATSLVPSLLEKYRQDPEATLGQLFGWTEPQAIPKPPTTTKTTTKTYSNVSLADLGLE